MLSVTDNRRQMISHSQKGGIVLARIHHMFLDAPTPVQDALVRYVVKGERNASAIVNRFIDENGYRIRAFRPVVTPLLTEGETHDLLATFRSINDKYFGNAVDSLITWGKRVSRRTAKPRRSIKLGSYSATERLIRVHPVLDKAWVPRYFLSYVIYHEMLHHVIPASQGGGRRMLHPPIFMHRERLFRDYDRALAWEKAHIGRLLQKLGSKAPRLLLEGAGVLRAATGLRGDRGPGSKVENVEQSSVQGPSLEPDAQRAMDALDWAVVQAERGGEIAAEEAIKADSADFRAAATSYVDAMRGRLDRIVMSGDAEAGLDALLVTGALAAILPEVEAMVGFGDGEWRHRDVWKHTKQVVRQAVPKLEVR